MNSKRTPSKQDFEENFLLSGLRRRSNDNPPVIIQSVNLHGKIFNITGIIAPPGSVGIFYQSRCPKDLSVSPTWPENVVISIEEYFSIFHLLYYHISFYSGIDDFILENSLENLISNQLEVKGKITQTQFHRYIDFAVFCRHELWDFLLNEETTDEMAESIWRDLHRLNYKRFKKYILLNQ